MGNNEDDMKSNETAPDTEASESDATATAEAAAPPDELSQLKKQLEDQKNDYLRLAAEFDNYRKRTNREFSTLVKSANENLIGELIEVLDNFERAFKSREEKPDFEAYHKGMSLVFDRLNAILGRNGLKKFASLGEKFDPSLHDAMMQVEDGNMEPDTVALEIEPGYMLNDKVIRHARVGVVQAAKSNGENK